MIGEHVNKKNIMIKQVTKQIMEADIMTFLFEYFGCDINLNTAEGIDNWANVIHRLSVGITRIYNAIPFSSRSLDKSILLIMEKTFVIIVLPLRIINELINFLFIKHFPYVEFSFIIKYASYLDL